MKLQNPFVISSRLAPAVNIGGATLSFCDGQFVFDLPNGTVHIVDDFHMGSPIAGDTPESRLQGAFAAILSFLSACAESRQYATRQGKDPSEGENSNLFPAHVGEWAESVSDEIGMLAYDLEETKGLITQD